MITSNNKSFIAYSKCSFALNGINNIGFSWDGVIAYVRDLSDVIWLNRKLKGQEEKVILIIHRRIIPAKKFLMMAINNLAGIYTPYTLNRVIAGNFNGNIHAVVCKKKIKLSCADKQILQMMTGGQSFYSLSDKTGIPVKTLYSRKRAIYKKIGFDNSSLRISDEVIKFILSIENRECGSF